jgi:hypothetical protein
LELSSVPLQFVKLCGKNKMLIWYLDSYFFVYFHLILDENLRFAPA